MGEKTKRPAPVAQCLLPAWKARLAKPGAVLLGAGCLALLPVGPVPAQNVGPVPAQNVGMAPRAVGAAAPAASPGASPGATAGANAGEERGQSPAAPDRIVAYKQVKDSRGQWVPLTLNIFNPPGHRVTDKRPVVVYFFGGGWIRGEPNSYFKHCAYFASRGIVAIAADYRTQTRFGTTPFECVADGKSAMRYVRFHAGELGIDPARIVAVGGSAGGHVAVCTAVIPNGDEPGEDISISCRPDAIVLYNPVTDTSDAGYGHKRLGARWQEISPVHQVRPGLPPTLVFHGDADKTVPYANAQAFERAMKAAGNAFRLVTFPRTGHGFSYHLDRQQGNDATRETDRFLASLGYVQGEPTLAPPGPDAGANASVAPPVTQPRAAVPSSAAQNAANP